jgi:HEAT repeat protein
MGEARQFWLAPASEPIGAPPTREKPRGGTARPLGLGLVRPAEEMSDLTLTVAQAAPAKPRNEPPPLASAVPALVASLRDEHVRNRLAALDAIEAIATRPELARTLAQDLGAAPAAEIARAVTRALSDPDRFVRWAAARTLGEMAPLGDVEKAESVEQGAVRGLARLQYDNDPDVRMWSAQAVEKYGKAAQAAVPALAQAATNRGDLEARISAAHAIQVIGGHPEAAVPALAENLGASNVRLRRAAAEALSAYGAEAAAAKPALNRALFDSDPEVRRIASEAMLKIGPKR